MNISIGCSEHVPVAVVATIRTAKTTSAGRGFHTTQAAFVFVWQL